MNFRNEKPLLFKVMPYIASVIIIFALAYMASVIVGGMYVLENPDKVGRWINDVVGPIIETIKK